MADLGLALSGGGSRAAGFHRGTLRALGELDLVRRVESVSSVSGGSVFAASWLAARARGKSDDDFLGWMADVLRRGFIKPALLHPRVASLLWRSRTELLADAFDRLLFDGVSLAALPASPRLCLNTTMLNNARAGRFSQQGFSAASVGAPSASTQYPWIAIEGLTLGWAVAASAAFPFGLPPLAIARRRFPVEMFDDLASHRKLVFTDGGVLENTGIERLLQKGWFEATHIVSSDAGLRDTGWQPSLLGRLKGTGIFLLSAEVLDRLLLVMNDKQNKSMRELLFAHLVRDELRDRGMLFVRLQNDWSDVVGGISEARRRKLGVRDTAPVAEVEAALARSGVDLSRARELYASNGGSDGWRVANAVTTGFTALSDHQLARLEGHARWQVHALVALYGMPATTASAAAGTRR